MKLFDYDGPLMTVLRKLLSVLLAGVLFLLCCIPVFTAGASFAALYDVTERSLKDSRGYVVNGFFDSLKENWRQTLPAGAVFALVFFVFEWDVYLLKLFLENGRAIGNFYVIIRVLEVLVLLYAVWVFSQISRFRNTLKQILKNALLLSIRHLGASFCVLLLLVFGAVVMWIVPVSALFMPVVVTWLMTAVLDPVFEKYKEDGR